MLSEHSSVHPAPVAQVLVTIEVAGIALPTLQKVAIRIDFLQMLL